MAPDTLSRRDEDTQRPSLTEMIRRERRPLPAHDLDGGNYRAWAAAVCQAEVAHRRNDFERAANRAGIGLCFDLYLHPNDVMRGSYEHEARAGEALNWLSHLQTHDSRRHGPWQDWSIYSREEKIAWARQRRKLLRGFLGAVAAYLAARTELERKTIPVLAMQEAA